MPTLLCFGDSNTHGSPPANGPGPYARYGHGVRWPSVCAGALGERWEVIEEGLPGRTAQFDDPGMGAHMNGWPALRIALESHGPLDVLAVMLGTNDVKTRFAPTPARVTAGIAGLLDIALSEAMQERHGGLRVLLVAPPKVVLAGLDAGEFHGAEEVSAALPDHYRALAEARGCAFLDANDVISVSPLDGIHFDETAHGALGKAVAEQVTRLA
ncbi:Lipolytic enzyme, G-D-S-L [Oceanicola granulosus HTCC2516]|uniref:Lipolytic enzyme, G-D-S-L n=1 Tax=Oceanicola granulosus (strain ATCC BAA-861 / DSM 15982 / KCTC 12143 / HTCC2516) TaxID=314256 RepID=Q2CK68_OCEGH|nr:SGNH/GDSL hydrolase family protein [Oceanicola granulosus]EAR52921.1 Lipolytic enzyme, G-D-S-L [Oceanicola granulosus HTCC2516]